MRRVRGDGRGMFRFRARESTRRVAAERSQRARTVA